MAEKINTFEVLVTYEEGFKMWVDAESEDQVVEKVDKLLADYAEVHLNNNITDVIHRDWIICGDIEKY